MLSENHLRYRYFVELAYNGTAYHGWQIQPNAETVQEVLNKAFSLLLREDINLIGCGRTDAGVHAGHFVAHMDTVCEIESTLLLTGKLNRYLGNQIRISRIERVSSEAHARFKARSRTYLYLISRVKDPFLHEFSWFNPINLNLESMQKACEYVIGNHDFTSFSKLHSDTENNICTITCAEWQTLGDLWIFKVKSDRFLRNMVRAMVGTLIEIGKETIPPEGIQEILQGQNRSLAGISAPAKGLFLYQVDYPLELFVPAHGHLFHLPVNGL